MKIRWIRVQRYSSSHSQGFEDEDDKEKFLRLEGHYCSYLLPKQALATQTEKPNATWQMSG